MRTHHRVFALAALLLKAPLALGAAVSLDSLLHEMMDFEAVACWPWYGEGDEKIRLDDETLPSFLGTGTRGQRQTPFANQIRVDESMTQGNNVLTRTRNLDGIPFLKSFDFDMELISWRPTKLIYAATTYWYAFPGASSNLKPQPSEASLFLPIKP